jgi:hypothetical protein
MINQQPDAGDEGHPVSKKPVISIRLLFTFYYNFKAAN